MGDSGSKYNACNFIPLVAIALFTLASLAFCLYYTKINQPMSYFITPARLWELSLGGVIVFLPRLNDGDIAVRHSQRNTVRTLLSFFFLLVGLALMLYAIVRWSGKGFPGWPALFPTIGCALVIYANNSAFNRLAAFRPLKFIGDISYSLYLYHWPLIILVPLVIDTDINVNNTKLKIIIFIVSLAMAALSYYIIEQPTRKMFMENKRNIRASQKNYSTLKAFAFGVICLTLVIVPTRVIEVHALDFSKNVVAKAFERAEDTNDISFGARATHHIDELSYNPYGKVDRSWAQFATSYVHGTKNDIDSFSHAYGIDASSTLPDDFIGKPFGDTKSDKTLLVLGDSHSEHWYPAIDVAAKKIGYKVVAANVIYGAGGLFEFSWASDTWKYEGDQSTVLSIKKNNDRYKFIIKDLVPQADCILVGVSSKNWKGDNSTPARPADYAEKIAATFVSMAEVTGKKPILLQDNPIFSKYSKENISSLTRNDASFRPDYGQMDKLYNRLREIGMEDTFTYLRTESLFIDPATGMAHTQIGGIPVYYDSSHVNTLYSASAGEYFASKLGVIK
jgi:hypothetical protein